MPLRKSATKEALSENIAREIRSGRPRKQAVATSYAIQKKYRKEK